MADKVQGGGVQFKAELNLNTLILLIGGVASVGAVIWQGGALRATLEDAIRAEQLVRETENANLQQKVAELHIDLRELRATIINPRAASRQ